MKGKELRKVEGRKIGSMDENWECVFKEIGKELERNFQKRDKEKEEGDRERIGKGRIDIED